MKVLEIKCFEDEIKKRKILGEVGIFQRFTHPNVIRLLEVFNNDDYAFVVMEFASNGDLMKVLKNKGPLTELKARHYFSQIASGLKHIHDKGVIHRDIKLDNILIDEYDRCKICDFGVSRLMTPGEVVNEQCGTPAFLAPEIIQEKGYEGFGADVWSLGVLLYALLTGITPFVADSIPLLHQKIVEGKFEFPEKPVISGSVKDLISKMLVLSPKKRATIAEVLAHPWLKNFENEQATLPLSMGGEGGFHNDAMKMTMELGFPRELVLEGLKKRKQNHATACYYLFEKDFGYN